ncbi:MAG: polysaccharide deacetylase family protein [Acidobacteriota bacterium]
MDSQILILGLHRVGFPPRNAKIRGLFTTPRLLGFQLRLLKLLGFRFMTLKDAMADGRGRIAVITFDDGYADNFTNALPILERMSIPATVFVVTNDLGRQDVVWDEASEDLPADLLSWSMLRHLVKCGWEVGSHAHEHVHLARYSAAEQAKTIKMSVDAISDNLGLRPVSFAYPYGSYDQTTKEILKAEGIENAVTINPATYTESTGPKDYLELSRLSVGGRNYRHYIRTLFQTLKSTGGLRPVGINTALPEFQSSAKAGLV